MTKRRQKRRGAKRGAPSIQSGHRAGSDPSSAATRQQSRHQLSQVWQEGRRGRELDDRDSQMFQIMSQHPEWQYIWDNLEVLSDHELEPGAVSPIMHILMHEIVENQITGDAPPETRLVVEILVLQGLDRHEAIHRVAALVADQIYTMMKHKLPYDREGYIQSLWELVTDNDADGFETN